MDSEESATVTTIQRNKRQMIFANKKRVIEVIQCSGEDMNLVLTSGIPTQAIAPTPIMQRPLMSPSKCIVDQLDVNCS